MIKTVNKNNQRLRLLNYSAVMELLCCSESALRALHKKGVLEFKYFPGVGRRWLASDVQQYIKEQGI